MLLTLWKIDPANQTCGPQLNRYPLEVEHSTLHTYIRILFVLYMTAMSQAH